MRVYINAKGHMQIVRYLIPCLALVLTACSGQKTTAQESLPLSVRSAGSSSEPPAPHREFRAAWVATVGNIDWPTKPGLSTSEQQREVIQILDRAQKLKLNAIVLQVRTSCDA